MRIDELLVPEVLARLDGAGTSDDVPAAPLPVLLDLPGVRAAAVVLRQAGRVVVAVLAAADEVGSAGDDVSVLAARPRP